MSAHTRKHPTKKVVCMHYDGATYLIPKSVADKYKVKDEAVDADDIFEDVNAEHTKAGALLRGIRIREGLTQVELAKRLKVTQSDISQMENGARKIGRKVAQRIAKLFDVNYRSFLE